MRNNREAVDANLYVGDIIMKSRKPLVTVSVRSQWQFVSSVGSLLRYIRFIDLLIFT